MPFGTAKSGAGSRYDDFGKLVLRVTLGALVLLHGLAKIPAGPGRIQGLLSQAGLPDVLAFGVYVGEVAAPIALIVGFWTRPAALVVAMNMLFAVYLVHAGQVLTRNQTGGWGIELQGMYLLAALAVALLGAGRLSADGLRAR